MWEAIPAFRKSPAHRCKSRSKFIRPRYNLLYKSEMMLTSRVRRAFMVVLIVCLASLPARAFAQRVNLFHTTFNPSAISDPDEVTTLHPFVNYDSGEKELGKEERATAVSEFIIADTDVDAEDRLSSSIASPAVKNRRGSSTRHAAEGTPACGDTAPVPLAVSIAEDATALEESVNTVHIRQDGRIASMAASQFESASTHSTDLVMTDMISDTITVSFQGIGSGSEQCSGDWGYQRITYNMDIHFEVQGQNPTQTEDIVSYELSRKTGTVHFQGTAEDYFNDELTTFNFNRNQSFDIEGTAGTFEYSTTQCDDTYIGFPTPSSSTLPYSIYLQYSGLLGIIRNTVNMPYPWNAGIGCLSNNYDIPATDDFDCECPDDNDNGKCSNCDCPEEQCDPIRITNGNRFETAEDLQFNSPFRGNLAFRRSYNSRTQETGPLGYGWTHTYDAKLVTDYDPNPDFIKILDETGRGVYFENGGADIFEGRFNERSWVEMVTSGGTEYVWHRLDRKKFIFDTDGQLIRIFDEAGNQQILSYNAEGLLDTVADVASGRILIFAYNGGFIQSITGPVTSAVPTGIWVNFAYDANQNLTSVTYADGSGLTYKYEDPNDPNNLTEKRDKSGHFLASWSYDEQDRAITNTSRDGRGGAVDYDTLADENKVAVTDEYGATRFYAIGEKSCRKQVTEIEGPVCITCGENIVRMEYNDDSLLTLKEYANGREDHFQDFDSNGNAQTEILAAGTSEERVITYTYSQYNLVLTRTETSVLGTGNKQTIWDYDDDYNDITNENPTTLLSRKIEKGYTRDISGSIAPYEYITTYYYQPVINPNDSRGLLSSVDGPRPGIDDMTTYTYYPTTGDLKSITQPEIGTVIYGNYDAAGNVGLMTDVNLVPTTYKYDGRNRLLTTTLNGSFTKSITYTVAGEIDIITDESGRTLDHDYDVTYGRLLKITDPTGNYLQYDYDNFGNRIQDYAFDKNDIMRRYQRFDYLGDLTPEHKPGRLWKVINRNHDNTADVEIIYGYDNMGNLRSLKDANGKETTYGYDLFSRLATVTQPGGVVTEYGYDSQGNLISVVNAEGQETVYSYDDMGRLLTTNSPDTGITRQTYDEAGNLQSKTPNNGITATYSYDNANRLTQITYADASQNVLFTYDAYTAAANYGKGRLTGMIDPSGSYAYTYDVQGNLTSEEKTIDSVTYTTAYAYDPASRLRSITYPSERIISYVPDATDVALIASVSSTFKGNTVTLADSIEYQPFGPLTGLIFGNGIELVKTYDLSYRVDTILAGAVQNIDYSIDDAGNITSISDLIDPSKNRTYSYDDLHRLTGINGETNYTYDDIGNRLTKTINGQSDTYYYYVDGTEQTNIIDSITGDNPQVFSHDDNGNITGIGTMILEYSPQTNRLTQVLGKGFYTYNANGQRVKKVVGGITTIYHYDFNGNLIGETSNNSANKDFIYLGNQRLTMVVDYPGGLDSDDDIDGIDLSKFVSHFGPGCSGIKCDSDFNRDGNVDEADLTFFASSFGHLVTEHYYYHNDHIGTPLRMSSQRKVIVWEANYMPFGNATVTLAAIANNFRFPGQYYDEETSGHYNYHRYYDSETGRYLRADPIDIIGGINLYEYVLNDPVNSSDFLGLKRTECETFKECMDNCYNNQILSFARLFTAPLTLSVYEIAKGRNISGIGAIGTGLAIRSSFRNTKKGIEAMPIMFEVVKGYGGEVLGDNFPHLFMRSTGIAIKQPSLGSIVMAGLKGFAIGEAIGWGFEGGYWAYCWSTCRN